MTGSILGTSLAFIGVLGESFFVVDRFCCLRFRQVLRWLAVQQPIR